MTRKPAAPAKKWYLKPRFMWLMGVVFVLLVIVTRNLYEPLLGMLIFWATLIVPAVMGQAWQRLKQSQQDVPPEKR